MPSSGTTLGDLVPDGNERSYLAWQVNTQEVANNRTLIDWQLYWDFVTYSCRGLRNGQAVINGVTVYYNFNAGDNVHPFNAGHDHRVPDLQVASGQIWIGHGEDGNQVIQTMCILTGFSGQTSQGWGEESLPQIARLSSAPTGLTVSEITQTTARVQFTDAGDGAPVTSRQISRSTGTDPDAGTITSSDGDDVLTGLTPNTTYHVWARTANVAGNSPWSSMGTFETIAGARIKVSGIWKKATPYVKVSGTWKLARPWTKVMGVWKENI